MKITGIFTMKDGTKIVDGRSPWNDNVSHKIGDVLVCGLRQWIVVDVDHIHQGCFGAPSERWHVLKLKPVNHNDMPNKGDVLVKQ